MKRIFALILVLTLLSCVFVGCKDEYDFEPTVNDATTLTVLAKEEDISKSYMTALFDLYTKKTGKRIKTLAVKSARFAEVTNRMFAEGKIPDILFHFNDTDLLRLDTKKNFLYLNEEEHPWIKELDDTALSYAKDTSGNVIGLPFWESSVSGCYYNKKLLAGYKIPATQTEFDNLCRELKKVGDTPLYWSANFCNWMFQFAIDPVFANNPSLLEELNADKKSYADIPAMRSMAEWFITARDNGWFNVDFAKSGESELKEAMTSGKAAMVFVWDNWIIESMNGKYKADDFGIMPVFMGTASHGTYEGGNLNMFLLNKNGKKSALAVDFLKFCAAPANYNVAFDGVSTAGCFKNHTTNVQSAMVTENIASVNNLLTPSTAWPKIIGYRQDDVGEAFKRLMEGKFNPLTEVDDCLRFMDELRRKAAKELGIEGY